MTANQCRCQYRPGAVCLNTADGPDGLCAPCRIDGGDGHPNRDCPFCSSDHGQVITATAAQDRAHREHQFAVDSGDERVAEAAKRLEAAFRWIDTNDGYPEDYRIIAAVTLGLEPARADVEASMGLGWQE